jgi:hypothetical protein
MNEEGTRQPKPGSTKHQTSSQSHGESVIRLSPSYVGEEQGYDPDITGGMGSMSLAGKFVDSGDREASSPMYLRTRTAESLSIFAEDHLFERVGWKAKRHYNDKGRQQDV